MNEVELLQSLTYKDEFKILLSFHAESAANRDRLYHLAIEYGIEDMALAYNDENERTQRIQNRLLELYMGVINENK